MYRNTKDLKRAILKKKKKNQKLVVTLLDFRLKVAVIKAVW